MLQLKDTWRYGRVIALAAVFLIFPMALSFAAGNAEGVVNSTEGVAIRGYDPVAYFTLGEPTVGSGDHTFEWDGAVWHFASADHRAMFAEDPERYAPSYGGYCAFAASRNQIADGDPELWTIHGDRLFLVQSQRFQDQFRDDIEDNIAAADKNWPQLRSVLAEATASPR